MSSGTAGIPNKIQKVCLPVRSVEKKWNRNRLGTNLTELQAYKKEGKLSDRNLFKGILPKFI